MTKLRDQLIRIQKKNYRRNVNLVRESSGYNPGIKIYEKEYLRHLKSYEEVSHKTELIQKVMAADLVYHGDYHTLKQSQHSVLRILREIKDKRDIILCLEMFHGRDQKYIDRFMAGELSEKMFLERIDYARKWPFHWDNWRPIISFCQDNQIPILGINTEMDDAKGIKRLRKRDQYSARIIAKALIKNPGKLIYVVDGDYHISPDHLPQNVENLLKLLDESAKTIFIFQNADNLYWKLCSKNLEESDVLKINDNKYCVMNTMPANKIQSYLNWLEYSKDAYFPVHQDWEDDAFEDRGQMVHEMVSTLAKILKLDFPEDALEKLTIYYPNNLDFMEFVHGTPQFKGQLRLIRSKIKKEEGFLLEYEVSGEAAYVIYLANSNINMAAEEAAHFLNIVLRGPLKKPVSALDRFYRSAITECLGFFGSKFINEKRKSHSENSIRMLLGQAKRGELKHTDQDILQVARYILQHFYLQRKTSSSAEFINKFFLQYNSQSAVNRMLSTQLGYILGNKLYYALKRGKFSLKRIQGYFCNPFDQPLEAFNSYLEISNRVKKVKHVSRL
ncbi:MAG: ChaN family lipoprotein [Thermodesulfobacteriota bacterium]|nr:ChaN family lipoprotein [Thermodesulfobacteriota bacterium]